MVIAVHLLHHNHHSSSKHHRHHHHQHRRHHPDKSWSAAAARGATSSLHVPLIDAIVIAIPDLRRLGIKVLRKYTDKDGTTAMKKKDHCNKPIPTTDQCQAHQLCKVVASERIGPHYHGGVARRWQAPAVLALTWLVGQCPECEPRDASH